MQKFIADQKACFIHRILSTVLSLIAKCISWAKYTGELMQSKEGQSLISPVGWGHWLCPQAIPKNTRSSTLGTMVLWVSVWFLNESH